MNTKGSLLFALNRIIDVCEMRSEQQKIEIDFHQLGLDNNLKSLTDAHSFFQQLVKRGCFGSVNRVSNTWFVVTSPNIEKLTAYKRQLQGRFDSDGTTEKDKQKRMEILIDSDNGIYRKDNPKINYPVKSKSKRFKLIKALMKNRTLRASDIQTLIQYKDQQVISAEIKRINKRFMNKLQLDRDLIIPKPTGGYALNKEAFNIIEGEPPTQL